jgi:hypothetical protein
MITHGTITHKDNAPCEFCSQVKNKFLTARKNGDLFKDMQNKNPKLQDIFKIFSDKELLNRLFEVYPDQKVSEEGYKNALKEIRTLKSIPCKLKLLVTRCKDEGKYYANISGSKTTSKMTMAIEFMDWHEWMGMRINPDSRIHYNYLDIAVHALWEMTWRGYSQEEVAKEYGDLISTVNKAEKEINEISKNNN